MTVDGTIRGVSIRDFGQIQGERTSKCTGLSTTMVVDNDTSRVPVAQLRAALSSRDASSDYLILSWLSGLRNTFRRTTVSVRQRSHFISPKLEGNDQGLQAVAMQAGHIV